ncbi:MAG: hypothetical protein KIT56_07065, partial [Gammaproteobacteria bacterium]|nr:hypothetical protein [Gammaproteobacteria bacterium]
MFRFDTSDDTTNDFPLTFSNDPLVWDMWDSVQTLPAGMEYPDTHVEFLFGKESELSDNFSAMNESSIPDLFTPSQSFYSTTNGNVDHLTVEWQQPNQPHEQTVSQGNAFTASNTVLIQESIYPNSKQQYELVGELKLTDTYDANQEIAKSRAQELSPHDPVYPEGRRITWGAFLKRTYVFAHDPQHCLSREELKQAEIQDDGRVLFNGQE